MRNYAVIGGIWALLAALAGCGGDGPTEPAAIAGSMSFTYSGAASGSFAVSGDPRPGGDGATGLWFNGPPRMLFVGGVKMHSATRGTFMDLMLPDVTAPRSFSLDDEACLDFDAVCPVVIFAPDVAVGQPSLSPETGIEEAYFFTSGTVVVTSVSGSRVSGTFAGTAETTPLQGASKSIAVSNGKFDVEIRSLQGL